MNSSSSNSVHEEEYEVERIDDHRFTPGTKRVCFFSRVITCFFLVPIA
jgi:hypothetical protein